MPLVLDEDRARLRGILLGLLFVLIEAAVKAANAKICEAHIALPISKSGASPQAQRRIATYGLRPNTVVAFVRS